MDRCERTKWSEQAAPGETVEKEGGAMKKRVGLMLGGLLVLAACSHPDGPIRPGLRNLERDGISRTYTLTGDYRSIAKCVMEDLDTELRWGFMDVSMPAADYTDFPAEQRWEMYSLSPTGVHLWTMDLQQKGDEVEIRVLARPGDHAGWGAGKPPRMFKSNHIECVLKRCA